MNLFYGLHDPSLEYCSIADPACSITILVREHAVTVTASGLHAPLCG